MAAVEIRHEGPASAAITTRVEHDRRIDAEVTHSRIRPCNRGVLIAAVRREALIAPLRWVGDRDVAGLMQDVARISEPFLVDEQRAIADIEARQKRRLVERGSTDFDADAANKRGESFGQWIGEHGYAAFGSASLACANAQSIHGVSAATSDRSTMQPHQMRRPGGASRCVAMS